MKNKLFNFPIKIFNPDKLMDEILKANDGDVFVLNEVNVAQNIGDYRPEITTIQVRKVVEPETNEVGMEAK